MKFRKGLLCFACKTEKLRGERDSTVRAQSALSKTRHILKVIGHTAKKKEKKLKLTERFVNTCASVKSFNVQKIFLISH